VVVVTQLVTHRVGGQRIGLAMSDVRGLQDDLDHLGGSQPSRPSTVILALDRLSYETLSVGVARLLRYSFLFTHLPDRRRCAKVPTQCSWGR